MACVFGLLVDSFWTVLRPSCSRVCGPIVAFFFFTACVWTIGCANMLDCFLIYVDICVFRYIDMDGCKLYVVYIIIHDTEYKIWYVNIS